jgi:hypothetical protein
VFENKGVRKTFAPKRNEIIEQLGYYIKIYTGHPALLD